MNDARFHELLNLYLDHQLAPAEAAELEAEVMADHARRRVYDQYCRLQRGCSLLGERERSVAPESRAFARSLRDVERKISSARRSSRRPAYAGFFAVSAMAACVALVFVLNRAPSGSSAASAPEALAQAAPQGPKTDKDDTVLVAGVSRQAVAGAAVAGSSSFEIQPVLAAAGFGVARNAREAGIAASDPEALEWMKRVEQLPLQRIVVDDEAFETQSPLHQDNREFHSRQAMEGAAEFTAFQFQR